MLCPSVAGLLGLWAAVGLLMGVHGGPTTATTKPEAGEPPIPPPSLPPESTCPAGQVWSQSAGSCCPVCSAGMGATGVCVTASADGSDTLPTANTTTTNNNNTTTSSNSVDGVAPVCRACEDGASFSPSPSHEAACRTCSPCPKNAVQVSPCNATHDTQCRCQPQGLFFLDAGRGGRCELCDLCPAGWGASTPCGPRRNTVCHKCLNGTFSSALSATEPCRPCRAACGQGKRITQPCSATHDIGCEGQYMDSPPMYRFNGDDGKLHHDLDLSRGHLNDRAAEGSRGEGERQAGDEEGGMDVIPLYCAALGAVVVGLLLYVAFVHYRRMRDKRLAREPHEDVEYSKASGADSGVFVDPDHPHYHHHHHHPHHHHQQQQEQRKYQCVVITSATRLRDLPVAKKKELEATFLAGSRAVTDWKGLARELGYNSGKIATFESRGSRDPGAPYRHVVHDWSRLEGATVAAFLRALRNTGRQDVVKFLQAECAEHLQPLTATLPQQVV